MGGLVPPGPNHWLDHLAGETAEARWQDPAFIERLTRVAREIGELDGGHPFRTM